LSRSRGNLRAPIAVSLLMDTLRRTLTLGGAALVAATTLASGVATAAGSTTTPECTAGDLAASYHDRGAGMSHRYGTLVLENTGDTACTVQGYGGLSYVGHGDGTQVGAPAARTPAHTPRVVLQPGDRAHSAVQETSTAPYPKAECRPTRVDGFRVYVPDETRSLYVAHRTTACANPRIDQLAHKPYH
jgi:hypothetical protein